MLQSRRITFLTRLIIVLFLITGLKAQSGIPWADGTSRAEDLRFKLVTFGIGDEIPSYWGHTAMIVEDSALAISRIYNFGLFSIDSELLRRFVTGRLMFEAGVNTVPGYLLYYKKNNRDVRIASLDIPLDNRRWLAGELARNTLPENKRYLYHHYYENCATRLRDLIDQAVDGALARATMVPDPQTLRDHTRRYVCRNPALEGLLMFLMNDNIDQATLKWDAMFLPDELEKYVRQLEYEDDKGKVRPLVTGYWIYYQSTQPQVPERAPGHWLLYFAAAAIFSLPALICGQWRRMHKSQLFPRVFLGVAQSVTGLLIGIPGLALSLMSSFTDHTVTYHNENLLLANPLSLLLFIAGLALILNKQRSALWLEYLWWLHLVGLVLAVALKIFPAFDQANTLVIMFFLPLALLNLAALRLYRSAE